LKSNKLKKPNKSWLINKSLKNIVSLSEEMAKWAEYMRVSAIQEDRKEVNESLEHLEVLFNKVRGEK
jgi:hypothetical protein